MSNHEQKIYTCPMHPEVQTSIPGLCPECGMNLLLKEEDKKNHKDTQDKHRGHSTKMFLVRFWVSFILSIPVVAYSGILEKLFNWQAPPFTGSEYFPLVLSSVVFFYGGWIFLVSAVRELKAKVPGMMTLISLAIFVAYAYSVFTTILGEGDNLFWELTTLITVMLLGHWIEMKAVGSAQGALKELSKLLPDTAEVIRGDKTETVPLTELKVGDLIFIRPGGKVSADGVVVEGRSEIDESIVTGESKPVGKEVGSEVIAGTTNSDGALKVEVTKIGEHTFLAGIMRLVAEAQASKSKLQLLADKAAYYLTVTAITIGIITFIAWLVANAGFSTALERVVAVLVIACPHALGLAIPLVASISTTRAARSGFLVKQRIALEMARNVQVVLFDKTGTLTKGEYGVEKIWPVATGDENIVLRYAAAVDSHSEHFIAKAIVGEAEKRNLKYSDVKDFSRIPGQGVRGSVENEEVYSGGDAILDRAQVRLPQNLREELRNESRKGKTIIFVIKSGEVLGALALADVIREESREAIKALKEMEVKVAMITGDSGEVAGWVAKELQIDNYFSRVLPEEKAEKVKLLQSKSEKVAMVGDGINDAPALMQSDLGIAIGAGTNVAIESAGIILVKDDPRDIVKIIKLSKLTYSKMIQNLFWASGYNVVALPLAAGVLVSQGIVLQPAVAAILMSLSTVIVAVNAMFLKWKKFE